MNCGSTADKAGRPATGREPERAPGSSGGQIPVEEMIGQKNKRRLDKSDQNTKNYAFLW